MNRIAICKKCSTELDTSMPTTDFVSCIDRYDKPYCLCIQCWDSLSEEDKIQIHNENYFAPRLRRNGEFSCFYPKDGLIYHIVKYLNGQPDYSDRAYDCGELGILYIRLGGRWEWKWLNPEPLPDSLCGEKRYGN